VESSYRPYLCFFVLVCLCLLPGTSRAWQGKAVNVVNGDTIEVLHDGKRETIRLYGIMVPGEQQAFSREAKKFTSEKVKGKTVSIKPIEKGPSGAIVATLVVDRVNLNVELVRAGFAWVYDRSCTRPECRVWKFIEAKARDEKNGVWSLPAPVPPWEYREEGTAEATGPKR